MFNITWSHVCYECGCPMCVRLIITDDDLGLFLKRFGSWCYLKPFNLEYNTYYFKHYGGPTVKKVCVSCYFIPKRINLLARETGTKQFITDHKQERSKTHEEIFDYFTRFMEFLKRRDLELCLVSRYKQTSPIGLRMFLDMRDSQDL